MQSLISYQFIDAFPKQVTAMPVSYQGSELLQCSVTFGYTRYVTIHTPGGDNYDGERNYATRSSRKSRGNPTVPDKNIDSGYRSPPKLNRITGDPGPRTPPKLNRITGDPGPRKPPRTRRSGFEPSLDNDMTNARRRNSGSRNRNRNRNRNRIRAMRDMSPAEQQSINESVDFF